MINRLKRVEKLHLLKSKPMFSEGSQKERNIWFSNKNFQIPNVNGKYLIVPPRDLYFSRETRGRIVLQKGM